MGRAGQVRQPILEKVCLLIRVFRLHLASATALIGVLDLGLLLLAGTAGLLLPGHGGKAVVPVTPIHIATLGLFTTINFLALVGGGALAPETFRSGRIAVIRVLGGLSLGGMALGVLYAAAPRLALTSKGSLYAMVLAFLLLICGHWLVTRWADRDIFCRHVLILGTGPRALRVAALARDQPGIKLVGHMSLSAGDAAMHGALHILPDQSLTQLSLDLHADELVLALDERRNALPLSDLVRLRTTGVHIMDATAFIERETGRIDLRSTNPSALFFSDGFISGRRWSARWKRCFDVAAALILLVLVWPLLLLAGLAIRLDSPGPVLFRQVRVGLYGQSFDVLKLRSMHIDAEADGQARWAAADDPRVTRVGAWIRKVRIDELPQIWNVLRGEMSFVGPRPERPAFVRDLEAHIVYYAERHMVKPGITGWAQINYPYGASQADARAKLEYDLYYAKNYTLFLDILILLKTIRIIVWPDGAR